PSVHRARGGQGFTERLSAHRAGDRPGFIERACASRIVALPVLSTPREGSARSLKLSAVRLRIRAAATSEADRAARADVGYIHSARPTDHRRLGLCATVQHITRKEF